MFIPANFVDKKPVTITVQLPAAWMAEYFADWVIDAFKEQMLANEGQHLTASQEKHAIVFTRESNANL